jgi:hypothetical protein
MNRRVRGALISLSLTLIGGPAVFAADALHLLNTPCSTPAVMHCPDANCGREIITNRGPAVVDGRPRPGKAETFVYKGCKDGRVIADVERLDKGHTEGLEPKVTEQLVQLLVSARGGKLQR